MEQKRKQRLPRKIRIGAHTCSVEKVDSSEMMGPEVARENRNLIKVGSHYDIYGEVDLTDLKIRLSNKMQPSMEAETLAHEIGHAIIELCSLRKHFEKAKDEEPFVQSFVHMFCQVLFDNPGFRRMFEVGKRRGDAQG